MFAVIKLCIGFNRTNSKWHIGEVAAGVKLGQLV